MSRYIDADELIMRVNGHGTNKYGVLHDVDIRAFINEQPTIDAVPVDFINQKIVELQSCAIQHFDDGHEILATCVWETIRLLGSFLKEWRGKEKDNVRKA